MLAEYLGIISYTESNFKFPALVIQNGIKDWKNPVSASGFQNCFPVMRDLSYYVSMDNFFWIDLDYKLF